VQVQRGRLTAAAAALAGYAPPSKQQPGPRVAGIVCIATDNAPWKHVRQIRKHVVDKLWHIEDFERKSKAENIACRKYVKKGTKGATRRKEFLRPEVRRLEIEVSEKSASEYGRTLSITFERWPQGLYLLKHAC
jgi:hypothetical protein